MFNFIKDYLNITARLLRRVEDLEENQKVNDKMMLLMYKKIGKLEKNV